MDPDTSEEWYTHRLVRRSPWRRIVPDPYRWNMRRMRLGRLLDIGCGVGRCLAYNDGVGVGVDHNPTSIAVCRDRGLEAYTTTEFDLLESDPFDTLLLSHVLEHTTPEEGRDLVTKYLPLVRPGGRVFLITPQSAGQRSDPSHVRLLDRAELRRELSAIGCVDVCTRSFPFPEWFGRTFRHNENHAVGRVPDGR